ncbi:phage gp6-like head-tail connector protein [Hominisplanchenecus murintestinalis]|uniref:Phage gp6-like head-tail connector protein n=1 Tax=Hominisplanchenecus murintestinalis TaxID=2941517 RepID=A0AC61R0S5_9FIRM|nr:head-tail connector protein [Hominisplanchenecus murintestinalis]TGX99190.1 phage gp6-like head-tail connector protein [Hominisplanchenecus murintestinalis]
MKVSEISIEHIAEYLRLDDYTDGELAPLLESARAFIRSYTGLTDEEIDTHEDFYIAVMVLCQDMYDNRCMYVDKNNLNKAVDTILGMHCVNLL